MTTAEDLTQSLEDLQRSIPARSLSAADIERMHRRLAAIPPQKSHSILELKGLGKELWRSVDVDKYIQRERDSWR